MREPPEHVDALARQVIGAAIEVHKTLGPGFLESVYQEALAIELDIRGLTFRKEHPVVIWYKGRRVGSGSVDLLVGEELVVELKAVSALGPVHTAQVLSYLNALEKPLGLLINFNVPVLKQGIRRVVWSPR